MFGIALMELVVEQVGALDLDPDAFGRFYEDALPRVYGYFLHRCGGSVPLAETSRRRRSSPLLPS